MKSKEYITIIQQTHEKFSGLQLTEDFFLTLDEIRKSNSKYRKEAQSISLYPNHSSHGRDGFKLLRSIKEQLIEESESVNINPVFKEVHYRNTDQFIEYIYEGMDITDLINI